MAFITKINGYDIKDADAHSRLDAVDKKLIDGVGKIDEIQVSGNKLSISTDGKKSVNIETDGTYNASSNKVATVQTVANEVAKVVASAPSDFDTLKEVADYIASDKTNAAQMVTNISKNTTDIDALEAEFDDLALETSYNAADSSLTLSVGSAGNVDTLGKTVRWIPLTFSSGSATLNPGTYGTLLNLQAFRVNASGGVELGTLSVYLPDPAVFSSENYNRYPLNYKIYDLNGDGTVIATITLRYNSVYNELTVQASFAGGGDSGTFKCNAVLFNE